MERSGSVPGAITDAAGTLTEEDALFFGEAVNALREELAIGLEDKRNVGAVRQRERAALDGMTPRQIILVGLAIYRRQNHDALAGTGRFKDWGPHEVRYSDAAIESALTHFSELAERIPEPKLSGVAHR